LFRKGEGKKEKHTRLAPCIPPRPSPSCGGGKKRGTGNGAPTLPSADATGEKKGKKGFCPPFITPEGGEKRGREPTWAHWLNHFPVVGTKDWGALQLGWKKKKKVRSGPLPPPAKKKGKKKKKEKKTRLFFFPLPGRKKNLEKNGLSGPGTKREKEVLEREREKRNGGGGTIPYFTPRKKEIETEGDSQSRAWEEETVPPPLVARQEEKGKDGSDSIRRLAPYLRGKEKG